MLYASESARRRWRSASAAACSVVSASQDEVPTVLSAWTDRPLGITVQTLTDDLAKRVEADGKPNVYAGEKGVLVVAVDPEGRAARAGVKKMDLIKEVANKSVANATDYRRTREAADLTRGVLLLVKTGEMAKLVLVK